MAKNSELKPKITDKSTDKRLKNLRPAWKNGESGNPNGYPKGQRQFKTVYREALVQLAKKNNKTPEDIEWEIISKGILQARTGDFKFYKDLLDRLFGSALQNNALLGKDGENLQISEEVKTKIDDLLNALKK